MTTELEELAGELNQAVPARSGGRPSGYTEALAAEICEEVALGGAIYKLCAEKTLWPAEATIYRWANEIPAFGDALMRARECKAHRFVEELPDIADAAATEDVRQAELRIKTRQWVAEKLNRAAYGQVAPAVAVQNNINVAGLAANAERKLIDLAERKEIEEIERGNWRDVAPEPPALSGGGGGGGGGVSAKRARVKKS